MVLGLLARDTLTKAMAVTVLLLSAGCVGLDQRPMNKSEDTYVSDQVAAMVEDNDGVLDTRDTPDVKCKRIKLTGSHIHSRLCYTSAEEKRQAEETMDAYYRKFGAMKCLDKSASACGG